MAGRTGRQTNSKNVTTSSNTNSCKNAYPPFQARIYLLGQLKLIQNLIVGISALSYKFNMAGVPGERDNYEQDFMLDYIDRDPNLNGKTTFALQHSSDQREFIDIIAALHWPDYDIPMQICDGDAACDKMHDDFREWQRAKK